MRALVAFQAIFDYVDSLAEQPAATPSRTGGRCTRRCASRDARPARTAPTTPTIRVADDGGYLERLVEQLPRGAARAAVACRGREPLARSVRRMIEYQALIHVDGVREHGALADLGAGADAARERRCGGGRRRRRRILARRVRARRRGRRGRRSSAPRSAAIEAALLPLDRRAARPARQPRRPAAGRAGRPPQPRRPLRLARGGRAAPRCDRDGASRRAGAVARRAARLLLAAMTGYYLAARLGAAPARRRGHRANRGDARRAGASRAARAPAAAMGQAGGRLAVSERRGAAPLHPRRDPSRKDRMRYRRLGNAGVKVSEIGLGSWLTYGGAVEDDAAIACIHRAFELGVNFFDTANVYRAGAAEEVVGQGAARDRPRRLRARDEGLLPDGQRAERSGPLAQARMEQCERSLKRLGVDYVDLYQCHRADPETPVEETLRALDDLVDAGEGALRRRLGVVGGAARRGAGDPARARPRPARLQPAAVLDARAHHRVERAAALQAARDRPGRLVAARAGRARRQVRSRASSRRPTRARPTTRSAASWCS